MVEVDYLELRMLNRFEVSIIYLQHVIFRARTNSLQFWNTGKNSGHDGIHVQLYPNLEKKSVDARGRTLWLTICSSLEFRELH